MNNFILSNGSSLYGNYRTRTFSEIFEDLSTFYEEWNSTALSQSIEELPVEIIFSLLYAYYGNSNIASSDENRFKYQLFSIMFQYGPTWNKELQAQKEIRALSIEDFQAGTQSIVNNAANPSGAPAADSEQILDYINNQNVSKTKRSKADGYALMLSLLKEDITETFINRFKKLFLTIVEPERPLWYVTEE